MKTFLTLALGFAIGALADAGLTWRLQDAVPGEVRLKPDTTNADTADTTKNGRSVRLQTDSTKNERSVRLQADPTADPTDAHDGVIETEATTGEREATTILDARPLIVPVEGIARSALRDTYNESRSGGRTHEALDIMAPRGTAVRAIEGGTIAKLFTSKAGGITVYQFDPTGTFCYYYAHLDRYRDGLVEGQTLQRGDLLGYVGSTGNAAPDAPHLHFAVFRLGPEREWWKGEPINPYPLLSE